MRHRMLKPPPNDVEYHPWPVRAWWWCEDIIPGFLPAERRLVRLAWQARHPRSAWYLWRKWRARPRPGDRVRACDGQVHAVTAIGADQDTLILDDRSSCSWMNCCEPAPEGTP